jgi:hypothetical protein
MGYKTERYTKDLEVLPDSDFKNFLIINPYSTEIKENDSTKIIEYAKKGCKVLVAADESDKILEALNVKFLYPQEKNKSGLKGELAQEANSLDSSVKARLKTDERYYETLLEDDLGIIAASIKYDDGEIIIFSLPDIFNNNRINKADNVVVISNLLKYMGGEDVGMDESLHGIINQGGKLDFSPLVWTLIAQAGIMLLMFYIAAMKRFGRPRRFASEMLRTSTEYVHSLAGLFQKAGASGFVVENCLRGLKRRVASACRITPETTDKKLLENIRYSNLADEGIMTSYLEKINSARKGKDIAETELVKIYMETDKLADSILS